MLVICIQFKSKMFKNIQYVRFLLLVTLTVDYTFPSTEIKQKCIKTTMYTYILKTLQP